MNKKLLFSMLGLFAVGLVSAGLVINTLTLTVGVAEPFTVEYAVLGDAGDYNEAEDGTCAATEAWFSSEDSESLPDGAMFPGESRKLCVKITNAGESAIAYNITSAIKEGAENYNNCSLAFPETELTGMAANGVTIVGESFTVPGSAPVVTGCEIAVDVARG